MKHLKKTSLVLLLLLISLPVGKACFIVNDLGISCATLYRCGCMNDGYCSFQSENQGTNRELRYLVSWITYDGPEPANWWENYPNAYGSSYKTNDPNSPIPTSYYNGKTCEIRWNPIPGVSFTDCSSFFKGKWDVSERACVECSGRKEIRVDFSYGDEEYRSRCESACGADPECDEITPDTGNCDATCNYVPPTTSTLPTTPPDPCEKCYEDQYVCCNSDCSTSCFCVDDNVCRNIGYYSCGSGCKTTTTTTPTTSCKRNGQSCTSGAECCSHGCWCGICACGAPCGDYGGCTGSGGGGGGGGQPRMMAWDVQSALKQPIVIIAVLGIIVGMFGVLKFVTKRKFFII